MRDIYMLIGERIRAAREARGWTQAQLGDAVNASEAAISRYETGKQKPDLVILKRIGEVLGKPLEYFIKEDYRPPPPTDALGLIREQLGEILQVEYVPILGHVPAGRPINVEENAEGWLPVPKGVGAKPDFALRVKGYSMKDVGILDGDYVFVKRDIAARPGDIVVARLNEDEVTVKMLDIDENQMGWLRSCNAEMADIPVHEEIEIIGVVVGVHREIVRRGER